MRRKHKNKVLKTPVYAPFKEADSDFMIPFDNDYKCVTENKDIKDMDIYELQDMQDELVESIADYDTIIDLQLDSNKSNIGFDQESLKMDRQRRQKLKVELRKVRERIKMLKYGTQEVAIAI